MFRRSDVAVVVAVLFQAQAKSSFHGSSEKGGDRRSSSIVETPSSRWTETQAGKDDENARDNGKSSSMYARCRLDDWRINLIEVKAVCLVAFMSCRQLGAPADKVANVAICKARNKMYLIVTSSIFKIRWSFFPTGGYGGTSQKLSKTTVICHSRKTTHRYVQQAIADFGK